MSVIVAVIGLASPASADSNLTDKSSSELMSLLPDDAIPADWKAEKDDLVGASSSGDQLCHHAGDANGAQVHFLVRLQALSHCMEFVDILYGKEDAGFDIIAGTKSSLQANGSYTADLGPASYQVSSADGPNTAAYPSVTVLLRPSDAEEGDPGQFITWVRVRGLLVVVRSFAWDQDASRAMLDQVVQSAITKLRAA